MNESYTGGCACGALRYDIGVEPMMSSDCQCRDCQRRSGTGHSSYIAFSSKERVKVTGDAKQWDIVGDGGTVKSHSFCSECGSPVYLTFKAMPDLFIIHAGSLDDPSRYKPQMVTYVASGHPWDQIDPALQKFDKMPPV